MILNQKPKVIEYFDIDPESYARKYQTQTAEGYAFRVRREVLLDLLGSGPGRVLDIGCGPGVMTSEIISRGWRYDGVDISPRMIETAKEKFRSRTEVSFSVGSVERLGFSNNYFDVVVAMGLMEYLDDELTATIEIRRVLKEGGRLIVSIPNWRSPARMWDRWLLSPAMRFFRLITGQTKSSKLIHREYQIKKYFKFLQDQNVEVVRWQSYNYRVIPRPFDFWFPNLTINLAKYLEKSGKHWWFLGTSLNIEAKKKSG